MLRGFIGSSSESHDRIVHPLRLALLRSAERQNVNLELISWKDEGTFQPTEHTLEAIERELAEAEFGIFIFANDDPFAGAADGAPQMSPRDNVLFEAGMWFGDLKRSRTFIVVERGAKVPTDYKGLQYLGLDTSSPTAIPVLCDELANQILQKMSAQYPIRDRNKASRLAEFGVWQTIANQRAYLAELEGRLLAAERASSLRSPIRFNTRACVDAYVEKLETVQRRFWTTTYFTSGFWLSNAGQVLEANRAMLRRLKDVENADVRRMFLLPSDLEGFLMREGQEVATARRITDNAYIRRRERDLRQVEQYVEALTEDRCHVRVGFDDGDTWNRFLTEELRNRGDPHDTELAIFDDSCVDMYQGGRTGHIASISRFPRGFSNFEAHLHAAARYFETLWDGAVPGKEALALRHRTFHRWKERIDYRPNWLARYEYGLEPRDRELKENELRAALIEIAKYRSDKKFGSYLDIGTCTARYPIALMENGVFSLGAAIIGIDEDPDCVEFSRAKLIEQGIQDAVRVIHGDFMHDRLEGIEGTEFDLITCMLGTVSHFRGTPAANGGAPSNGILTAVYRMGEKLSRGGLLLIGNWSDQARENGRFLKIYADTDIRALKEWTPSSAQLARMIKDAGLRIINTVPVPPAQGIELFVVEKPA